MQRRDARDDGQPEAESAGVAIAAGIEPRERAEDRRAIAFRNSFAIVLDHEAIQILVAHDGDVHLLLRVAQRIGQQVAERELHEPRLHPRGFDAVLLHGGDASLMRRTRRNTWRSHGASGTAWQLMRRPG